MNKIIVFLIAACLAASAQTITSVTPRNVQQGSAQVTIVISGSGFKGNQKVTFGSVILSRTMVSKTQMSAVIPSSLLTVPGLFAVVVGASNAINLQVCAPLVIPPQTLPVGTVGVPYSYQLVATGGCFPNP